MLLILLSVSFLQPLLAETQEKKPLFIAHYMAWFGLPQISGQWYQWKFAQDNVDVEKHHYPDLVRISGRRDVAAIHYPTIGPYDSTDPAALEYHILLSKEAGIDGFNVNWYGFKNESGQRRQEDKAFEELLKVAERLNFKVFLNFDDKCAFPPFQNTASRAEAVSFAAKTFEVAYKKYAKSPAYLKINGKPVFSNFGWQYATSDSIDETAFKADEWKEIFSSAKKDIYFIHDHQWHWKRSIEDAGFIRVADSIFPWIGKSADRIEFLTESEKLVGEGKMKMAVGIANPGFDNSPCWGWGGGLIYIPRRDGREYRDQLEESIKHHAGMIQLVTWNDFTEGSSIEPSEEYGEQYLKITAEYANRWTPNAPYGNDLDLPRKIYDLRIRERHLKESRMVDADQFSQIQIKISSTVDSFVNHDRAQTESAIAEAQKLIQSAEEMLPQIKRMEVTLRPSYVEIFAGEKAEMILNVKNPYPENVPLYIDLNHYRIPHHWMGEFEKILWLKPNEEVKVPFPIDVPKNAGDTYGWFTATVDSPYAPVTSNVSYLRVSRPYLRAEIGPVSFLHANRDEMLSLHIESLQPSAKLAKISFIAPSGWKVNPKKITQELPKEGAIDIPLTLNIPSKSSMQGNLGVEISYGNDTSKMQQPFAVLPDSQAALMEGDVDQDGVPDIVLANESVEIHCTPEIGGRILSAIHRPTGHNQLFSDYPRVAKTEGTDWNKWAEYGGINDWFPGDWPGTVWNNRWNYTVGNRHGNEVSVIFSTVTKGDMMIQRKISLAADSPSAAISYTLQNLSKETKKVFWTNHPDLAPGSGAGEGDVMVVPAQEKDGKDGVVQQSYLPQLQKMHYVPSENWVMGYDGKNREYFGQTFDRTLVEKVGVWEGKNFFTMELNFKKMDLAPGEKKNFAIHYFVGQDDLNDAIKKLRDSAANTK